MRLRSTAFIPLTAAAVTWAAAIAGAAPKPSGGNTGGQQICLPETDPDSPRRSRLKGDDTSSTEVLRIDLDNDGDPDIIEHWWHGKRARWFDENDDMAATDSRGDQVDDSVQIDRDGDGYYDGPSDMNIDWVDDDNDGDADLQSFAINPSLKQKTIRAGEAHWMVFVDVDDDNVHGFVDYDKNFEFDCWRTENGPNFQPDYNGNTVFLKEHLPVWAIKDPAYSWENPFAFYDTDGDGVTEMAIRHCDEKQEVKGEENKFEYDGRLEEAYVTYDLDNDAQRRNEMDYDLTFKFGGGKKLDYNQHVQSHPKMKAPDWVLPFYRYPEWRKIDRLVYTPHDKCYDETWSAQWGYTWLTFDEDDDDHRWERVELLYPEYNGKRADPYSLGRWRGADKATTFGLCGHPQSDMLGDRGEYDMDNSGKGQIYIGRWDGKIHLYGAEWGAWTVDEKRKYWGSSPVVGDSSPEKPQKVEEVVHYRDTNNNGFIDEIAYDYDGDRTMDLTVSLLEFGEGADESADAAQLINPAELKWAGMHQLFEEISEKNWQEALALYRAVWKKGLTTPELDNYSIAASANERYEHAYWLKEKIFRLLHERLAADAAAQKELRKRHFTGNTDGVIEFAAARSW